MFSCKRSTVGITCQRIVSVFLILITILSFGSCVNTEPGDTQNTDDLNWYLVKEMSSVGSMTVYSYNDSGLMECSTVYRDNEFISSDTCEYDELGRTVRIENITFDSDDNKIVNIKEYTYEGENSDYSKLIESNGFMDERRYDSQERLIFREVTDDGALIFRRTYEYIDDNDSYLEYDTVGALCSEKICDSNGNIVEDITYDAQGQVTDHYYSEYDSHNRQIRLFTDDKVISSAITEYNDDGLLISLTRYDADGKLYSVGHAKELYIYDDYDNLIKEEYYDAYETLVYSIEYIYSTAPTADEPLFEDNDKEINIDFAATHTVTELGIAYDYDSFNGTQAAIPWDIKLYNGCLYIGAGDYSNNVSPISIKRYNFETAEFEKCGTLLEECFQRFVVLDGSLVVPGCDPREGWELGNYYVLNEAGVFETVRTIPGGVHNFDMLVYDEKIFAALGVDAGHFPAAYSSDGGKTFTQIEFYNNGAVVDTDNGAEYRVIDLIALDGKLYAILTLNHGSPSVYVYDNARFEYLCAARELHPDFVMQPANKTVFDNKLYYVNRTDLIVSAEMERFDTVKLEGAEYVTDVLESDGELYVMGYTKTSSSTYGTSIYKLSGEDEFELTAAFEYALPAYSFDISDGVVYLGFADGFAMNNTDKTGMIGYVSLK